MELTLPFSDPEPIVEDEEEPSVLEYAREQGICIDYTSELPQLIVTFLSLKGTIDHDLRDPFDDDLTNAVATATKIVTKQRLAVTKDVALLLKSILTPREIPIEDPLAIDQRECILNMKQELPVLQTDAELDLLDFGTRVEPDLRDLRTRLPSEDLDNENDEGFEWPAKYFSYPAQCDAMIKDETFAVTRDVLTVLQRAVRDDFASEYHGKIMAEGLEDKKVRLPRHLTPPLLPMSPPLTPYVPSSPANRLPLASESSDSIVAEAKALEQQIMARDSLARHHSGSSDSMLLDIADLDALFDEQEATDPQFADHIPTILKRRADDLKVEGPLTPPILSDSPTKKLKSVSFAKMIQVGDTIEPWTDEYRPTTSDSHSTTDELFKDIEPLVNKAKKKVESEKLIGADTTARVEVPDLDFTLPMAPWMEYSQRKCGKHRAGVTELEAQVRYLARVKRDDLKTATTWHGISDLDLSWGWFASSTSTIKLNEKLHGETEFNKIQAELTTGVVATSSDEVRKQDGLRILDDGDAEGEEEIEPADIEERNDMKGLTRKRKLGLEEQEVSSKEQHKRKEVAITQLRSKNCSQSGQEVAGSHNSQSGPVFPQGPRRAHQTSANTRSQQSQITTPLHHPIQAQKEAVTGLAFGDFYEKTALHKFMETQGKVIESARPAVGNSDKDSLVAQGPRYVTGHHEKTARRLSYTLSDLPLLPNLPSATFIISSTLLQRRSLVKQVEQLHSAAELIYRDYTLPHSTSLEADIVLSPSTGILLTTLQQIKQIPLPGQALRSPVKERIATLQLRYERLIVLISEGLREDFGDSRPEDPRDREMLKELEAFSAQLEGDVTVQYVQGGEQVLARSIVENMAEYGLPHGSKDMGDIKLFAVETTWEIFLRRSGLNPFAAQVVIASLKVPTIISLPSLSSSPTSYEQQRTVEAIGLPMFLLMNQENRVKCFQAIMGGRRVLDRVSGLLDQQWLSAAHGFRM